MRKIIYDGFFDSFETDPKSAVFQVLPAVFGDSRGCFSEVLKECADPDFPDWFNSCGWVKQVNRSRSVGGTLRGCHAQRGRSCQGKLVQSVAGTVYDVITDGRPGSRTFGLSNAYVLSPSVQNMLWVPRGFLHGFAVPAGGDGAVFEYFCDGVYDKGSEFGVNPLDIMPQVAAKLRAAAEGEPEMADSAGGYAGLFDLFSRPGELEISEKDRAAEDFAGWKARVLAEYAETGKAWYE